VYDGWGGAERLSRLRVVRVGRLGVVRVNCLAVCVDRLVARVGRLGVVRVDRLAVVWVGRLVARLG